MNRRKGNYRRGCRSGCGRYAVSVAVAADKEIDVYTEHWRKSKALTLKVAEAMPPGELRLQAIRRCAPIRR